MRTCSNLICVHWERAPYNVEKTTARTIDWKYYLFASLWRRKQYHTENCRHQKRQRKSAPINWKNTEMEHKTHGTTNGRHTKPTEMRTQKYFYCKCALLRLLRQTNRHIAKIWKNIKRFLWLPHFCRCNAVCCLLPHFHLLLAFQPGQSPEHFLQIHTHESG